MLKPPHPNQPPPYVDESAVESTDNPAPAEAGTQPRPIRDDLGSANRVQWFGRPDAGEKPLGFLRLIVITLSGHIGVRPRAKRQEDFRRANGLHVFIAAIVYFLLIVATLIALTNYIVS